MEGDKKGASKISGSAILSIVSTTSATGNIEDHNLQKHSTHQKVVLIVVQYEL